VLDDLVLPLGGVLVLENGRGTQKLTDLLRVEDVQIRYYIFLTQHVAEAAEERFRVAAYVAKEGDFRRIAVVLEREDPRMPESQKEHLQADDEVLGA
jgi:hypothetical protein